MIADSALVNAMAAVRFAFIGCGNIARFHLRALRESTHLAEVTAAVDVRRASAEKFSTTGSPLAGTRHFMRRDLLHYLPHHLPCSSSLLKDPALTDPNHWRFDRAKSGGGILMDGMTHWVRPLRIWLV